MCFTFRESPILIIVSIPDSRKQTLVFVFNCTLKVQGTVIINVSEAYNEAFYV